MDCAVEWRSSVRGDKQKDTFRLIGDRVANAGLRSQVGVQLEDEVAVNTCLALVFGEGILEFGFYDDTTLLTRIHENDIGLHAGQDAVVVLSGWPLQVWAMDLPSEWLECVREVASNGLFEE